MKTKEEVYGENFVNELEKISEHKDISILQGTKGAFKATYENPQSFFEHMKENLKGQLKDAGKGIVVGDSAGASADTFLKFYHSTSGTLVLAVKRDSASTDGLSLSQSQALTQDAWAHLVCTWDSTISNGGKIYKDGSLIGTSSNSAFNVSEIEDTIAVGSDLDGTVQFNGEIDELEIDDRVWSAAEVLAVFNLPNGLPRTLI